MRIEQGEERKEINIAISEIIKDGGKLNIYPSVKNYFSIDYKPKKDTLTLVAGGYIGLIPINDDLAIEIKPKFSISNLTRIVSIAEDEFNTLSFFTRKYQEKGESNTIIFEFLTECLANELEILDSEGILKEYLLRTENAHNIRGRIDINQSIKALWSHGHFNKATTQYYDFSPNNAFNQLIKYTLKFCIDKLNSTSSSKVILRERLIDFYTSFEAIELDESRGFMEIVTNAIKDNKLSVLRRYYVNICEVCRLIIDRIGISFDSEGIDLETNSFTLDMANTFEKYLLNSIRIHRQNFPTNTLILDGNKEGKKKFYNQPSLAKGNAKPDIIIRIDGETKIIADAKYKSRTKDTDRYQVISHALSYGANKAVLILPTDEQKLTERLIKLGSVGDSFKVDVYEYFIDLSSNDLESEELNLTDSLVSLLE
ncbi:MAG: restriction endonuclease [Kangiella sp.]|nr:MAG: restriction endonuclease [Kangiella sp.]